MEVVRCPLCEGCGEHYTPPSLNSSCVTGYYKTCHGCGGRGLIIVPEDNPPSLKRGVGKK